LCRTKRTSAITVQSDSIKRLNCNQLAGRCATRPFLTRLHNWLLFQPQFQSAFNRPYISIYNVHIVERVSVRGPFNEAFGVCLSAFSVDLDDDFEVCFLSRSTVPLIRSRSHRSRRKKGSHLASILCVSFWCVGGICRVSNAHKAPEVRVEERWLGLTDRKEPKQLSD
jgi:hypothetical protein